MGTLPPGPSFLQNVSNDSSDLTENKTTEKDDFLNVVFFVVCLLGVPGNLFVIVVYVRNMYHAGVQNRSGPPETTFMINSSNVIVTSAERCMST